MTDRAVRLVLVVVALLGAAWLQEARAADDFLEPDKAFQFSARALDDKSVEVSYQIAPGYYLYRDKLKVTVAPLALAPQFRSMLNLAGVALTPTAVNKSRRTLPSGTVMFWLAGEIEHGVSTI